MRNRAGIILQARHASTRLPGKVLERIGPYSILEHCLRRLVTAGVARVVLATTIHPEDDPLADAARQLGVSVFRGSAEDVLGGYVAAAEVFGFEQIVRATGDNPAVDIQAPGRVLSALHSTAADYVCESELPYGAGVEAVTRATLCRVATAPLTPEDREHVTAWVRRHPQAFRVVESLAPAPLRRADLRLTVDTARDLHYVRGLFARTGRDEPSLRMLIEVAGRRSHKEVA
jgi:spore coat polysaccharide biosynthesis protein SpsF